MSASPHIAIFCRPLLAGQVKTRLIPLLGERGATDVYAQLVERTLHTVAAAQREMNASASIWVAGDAAHQSVCDWAARYALPVYVQCEGDLGARMLQSLATLARSHTSVLLIGTDCPALSVADLRAANRALTDTCHWVFTPAEDGGYVLVGSNAPCAEPFANVAWSSSEVMAQTRAALRANGLAWRETATLWDVDEAADVERARGLCLIDWPFPPAPE